MVNIGSASKGCTTCRLRRIRCDTTRPTCQRCAKSQRICLGYNVSKGRASLPDLCSVPVGKSAPSPISGLPVVTSVSQTIDLHQTSISMGTVLFPGNPMVSSTVSRRTGLAGYPYDIRPTVDSPRKAALLVLDVVSNGFSILRRQSQTIDARRIQLAKYHLATRELRNALTIWPASSALFTPVLFFAIYEVHYSLPRVVMIVLRLR